MDRFVLPLLIGLVCFVAALATLQWGGYLTSSAQVQASDLLMVSIGGPRLGARPVREGIVLVLLDQKSAISLGYVHSYEDDVRVYRKLFDTGARVVYDTRMVAAATEEAFAEVNPLLTQMLAINGEGRLMRDVWLSSGLIAASGDQYDAVMSQNVVNSHPHSLPSVASRLYPLNYFLTTGPRESAPLRIARNAWGLPVASSEVVGEELRRSGVMSKWHELSPDLVPKTEVAASPYRIDGHEIRWHPFLSATSLVPPAAFWVSYDPLASEYPRLSFVDVLNGENIESIRDKLVIIGYDAQIDPTSDTYSIPSLMGKASAAEVLACATQTVLDGRNMREVPYGFTIVLLATMTFGLALVTGLMKPVQASAAVIVVLLGYLAFAVGAYRNGWYADCVFIPGFATLAAVGGGIGNAWLNLRLRHRVLDLFGRYVPRAVVNQLMLRPELESLSLSGVSRDVTVLFADIRGFTTFSEDLSPEAVVRELNSLLEVMVACTFENEGTLDKFIGDAILVLFNAPLDQPDHADRAVRTAVNIQRRLAGHSSGLGVGIGVHRGTAVVGNIGTPERMEYTAIGSTVNIASRLCDHAKSGEVVVSQAVLRELSSEFTPEPIGAVSVKGISQSLELSRITVPEAGSA